MLMPNRHGNSSDYRYGYNGKESDNEIKGEGLQYDYGFRVYDPRLGKFLSQDPLFASYPWYTPYQFAGNNPIRFIDLDGLEEADKQQIDAANQYYQKTKLKQSDYFKNIPKGLINQQVKQRIRGLGKQIKQGEFYVCGPAAAAHITASHDPYNYVKTIFDLYTLGFANGKDIKGNDAIYNATIDGANKKNPNGNGKIDGIPVVDWMLLHSLRRSENAINWGGYDPHDKGSDVNKMSLVGEFSDLLERLGADVSINASGGIGDAEWANSNLSTWISEKKRAVLFVDSRQYTASGTGTYEDGFSKWISQNYGRHFIVLKGFEVLDDGKVKVDYWSNGKNLKKTFKNYEAFDKATMNYWLIENNGANKAESKKDKNGG